MSHPDLESVSDEWEVKTKEILIRLQREAPQEGLSLGLSRYMLERKPFALATQTAQDLKTPTDKLSDLVCGVPFTSDKHPWPKDAESGLWMQPIVQLNLKTLKEVFQIDWGEGVLQVWGRVLKDVTISSRIDEPMIIRHLSTSDIEEPLETLIPNHQSERGAKIFRFFDESSYVGQEVFKWYRVGDMYGTRQQLLDFSHDKVDDFGDEEFEWIDRVIESVSDSPLCGENYSEFLGGWGGKHGEQDASYGDGLVLRISDGEGAVVAIHRHSSQTSRNGFKVSYSLR